MTAGRPPAAAIFPRPDLDTTWMDRGECVGCDPELMFPQRGEPTSEAKQTCAACEVRAECLEYALAVPERHGIWGGKSERERLRLRRHRGALSSATAERVRALIEEAPQTTNTVAAALHMTTGYAQDIMRTLILDGSVSRSQERVGDRQQFVYRPVRAGGTTSDP